MNFFECGLVGIMLFTLKKATTEDERIARAVRSCGQTWSTAHEMLQNSKAGFTGGFTVSQRVWERAHIKSRNSMTDNVDLTLVICTAFYGLWA